MNMNVIILSDEELAFIKARIGNTLPRQDLMLTTPPSVLEADWSGTCGSCLTYVRSNSLQGHVCCPNCGQPVRSS